MKTSILLPFELYKHINKKRKKQLLITLILMFLSGITELLVINSVVPFIASIANPKVLNNLEITKFIAKIFAINPNEGSAPFIVFFALTIVLSAFLRISTVFLINRVSALVGNDISVKTFYKNISQPYEYHLKNSSSKLITQNTTYVGYSLAAFSGFLFLIYFSCQTILLSIGLILISPVLTIYSIFIFSIIYLVLGKTFKKIIKDSSKKRSFSDQIKVKTLNESLGSIRNLILESNHYLYINKFKIHDLNSRIISANNSILSTSPKYIIEALGLLFIIFASVVLMKAGNSSSSSVIISLGAFTLGIQKLLPAFQGIYAVINQIRFYSSDLENTLKYLQIKLENNNGNNITPLNFKKSIRFDSIYFSYDEEKYVVSNFNFEIFKGQKIGIIGRTGSGKTTISDLFMGLLKPTKGKIYIDGKDIYDKKYPNRIKRWRRSISHVPQDIFLSDTTIAENIAFGIDKKLISLRKLKECAKKAQIHEFIVSTKDGYLTTVGERGVRLSGGQLQRIAIARALYRNAKILVFDEATSALDKNTEIELMQAINKLSNELTIISIAHNHRTLKDFDRIIKVEKGNIFEIRKNELSI